ncbi:MAG TPA: hypothetical protein VMR25_22070 [Planctomycetaceae bacterium]|nr:hypothetical protein [Planctomycetaceae bacterium]
MLERGGSPEKIGTPVAFIESAWRRYTKHSRNKAQEMQGAVLPIAEKHHYSAPLLGCVLVGVYTSASMDQLRSVGFKVLHLHYPTVVQAFSEVGVDASFAESTPDAAFAKKMKQWRAVSEDRKEKVWARILELNKAGVDDFINALERAVNRRISAVRITPLHGTAIECGSVQDAIGVVEKYDESAQPGPLVKYEIQIRYSNGDKVDGDFHDKDAALDFLRTYQGGNWTPIDDPSETVD